MHDDRQIAIDRATREDGERMLDLARRIIDASRQAYAADGPARGERTPVAAAHGDATVRPWMR